MGTILLYITCQVGHYYMCIIFEINDTSWYTKHDSERGNGMSDYNITKYISYFFDIVISHLIYVLQLVDIVFISI